MQYKFYQICSVYAYRMTTSKISTYDGTKHYCQQVKFPTEMVLEGLNNSKLQDSVQLHTVLALFDQETVRNNGQPNYSRLKTALRLHIDQVMMYGSSQLCSYLNHSQDTRCTMHDQR